MPTLSSFSLLKTARMEVCTYPSATVFLSALLAITPGCIITDGATGPRH